MKSTKPGVRLIPLALLGAALASASHAAETPDQKRERQLLERLAKNDAQTAILQRRIDELEQRVQELRANIAEDEKAQLRPAVAVAQAPAPSPPKPASNAPSPAARSSAPGTFEVDEEAAQRALERTLTQAGALLLNTGTYELTPSFTYKRTEFTSPTLLSTTNSATGAPDLLLGSQRTRRNEMTAELGFRAGLPFQTQFEASLPYNYTRSSQLTDLSASTSANGNGMGDVTIGIAKTLARESGWRPDLIGRVSYNFGNGKRLDGTVDLGGGFRQLQGELVAIKRQDPLAFVASAFYGKTFEEDGIKPGNAMGFSLSALLAASPATSLQFGFSQVYRQKQELNGVTVNGSDQTYGIATIGASSVLSRDLTLITRVGIGLGNDAPKYTLSVALPILIR